MRSEIERTTLRNEAPLLKGLSRRYEASISIRDISEELKIDELTVKRHLKLLRLRICNLRQSIACNSQNWKGQ